jgi:hypothetical protein
VTYIFCLLEKDIIYSLMSARSMLADVMFLRSYMERLLLRRNEYIKNNAEKGKAIPNIGLLR